MIFTVAIHSAPYASSANIHALKFCDALLASGHKLARIFFYHEGVYTALASTVPLQDEADIVAQWQALAERHNVELAVCIANALKRGVINKEEADRYDKPSTTLASGFELAGLGQLIDAMAQSDRYIEFSG